MFGLFHGLILLPVILSIFGSDRVAKKRKRQRQRTKEDEALASAGMGNPAYVEEEVGELRRTQAH